MNNPALYVDPDEVTLDRARTVRTWRVNGATWRSIAARAADEWDTDYGSNQLFGEALCRLAAARLDEDADAHPWN